MTYWLLNQVRHSTVPLWIVYEANKGKTLRLSSTFFFFLFKLLWVPIFSNPEGICQIFNLPSDPPVAIWESTPGLTAILFKLP